jgi:membrane-bound metal-dependent hydrolase YbcI (DUF457 family)
MMARSHAISAAAGWLACVAGVVPPDERPPWTRIVLGAVIAAGAALLPDVDHPNSCVARTFGAPSRWVCRRIARGCARLHAATKTAKDRADFDGHRTASHTLLFALLLGVAVGLLCALTGPVASAVVAFCCTGLAFRGGVPRRGPLGATLAGALAAAVTVLLGLGGWWLGVAVGFGCAAHLAGDSCTNSGVPVFWPVKLGGRRWRSIGTPRKLRFATGGRVEAVAWWASVAAAVASVGVLAL